jgi:hypothetical protein
MIHIDFQGGAHGNFLEFVCNKIAGVETNQTPFNDAGASHSKHYYSEQKFYAGHYSFDNINMSGNKVIAIKIAYDDLLPLSQISLLRAGDYGFDNNELEIDTYNKLNNRHYRWVLDTVINSFFTDQIKNSYNNVRDSSWPEINNLDDFENLPENIKQECIEVHNLILLELNEKNPHCPRNVLREFFEIGFLRPENSGFITQQQKMEYPTSMNVYEFSIGNFYNTNLFIDELKKIAQWAQIVYNDWELIVQLHQQFLQKQPYKYSKQKCDIIVDQIINGGAAPGVNLIEESYINAMLTNQGYERRY